MLRTIAWHFVHGGTICCQADLLLNNFLPFGGSSPRSLQNKLLHIGKVIEMMSKHFFLKFQELTRLLSRKSLTFSLQKIFFGIWLHYIVYYMHQSATPQDNNDFALPSLLLSGTEGQELRWLIQSLNDYGLGHRGGGGEMEAFWPLNLSTQSSNKKASNFREEWLGESDWWTSESFNWSEKQMDGCDHILMFNLGSWPRISPTKGLCCIVWNGMRMLLFWMVPAYTHIYI